MYNAIFLRDSYLLLPDAFPTWEAFSRDLRSRAMPAVYQLRPLLENNRVRRGASLKGQCMAPCFLSDAPAAPIDVQIDDPEEVCPVKAELLTMAEYNARLRQVVLTHCPGCGSFGALTDSDDSLDGHHGEISLNGVCFYRWEGTEPPASFRATLLEMGDAFNAYWLSEHAPDEIGHFLTIFVHRSISARYARLTEDGARQIVLSWRSTDPLLPLLMGAICRQVERVTEEAVRLTTTQETALTPDIFAALTAPEKRRALRSSCRAHGAALAEMTWDAQDNGRIAASLRRMEEQLLLEVHALSPGRALLLLTEPATALKGLRYRAPLLERHRAAIAVHDADGSRVYQITFDMPARETD